MRKISLSRSVSVLALTAGLLGPAHGWGVDYTRVPSLDYNFNTAENWTPLGGPPLTGDTIIFNDSSSYLDTISVGSVKEIQFEDDIWPVTLTTNPGQDYGSSGINTVSVGTIADHPGGKHTINFESATMHGNLGTSGFTNNLQLNYTGASTIHTDGNSVHYYAHVDFGTSENEDVTEVLGGDTATLHGPLSGSGAIDLSGTFLIFDGPGSSYAGKIDISSGGSLITPANFHADADSSIIKIKEGSLVFSDSGSSGGIPSFDYNGNLVLDGSGTISIPSGTTAIILSKPITEAADESPLTLDSGTFVLGGSEASTYTGGTVIHNNTTLQTPSSNLPSSGGILFAGDNTCLEFSDTGAQQYAVYSQEINCGDDFSSGYRSIKHSGSGKLNLTNIVNNDKATFIVDGGGTLRLSNSSSNGDGFSAGAYVRSGSTLELDSGASLGNKDGVHFDNGGGNLVFFSSGTDSFNVPIDISGESSGTVKMSGTGTLTLGGPISGPVGVTANSGTLVLSGAAGNYNGPTTIAKGATLTLSGIDDTSTGGDFTINGGTFDISGFKDMSYWDEPYYLTDFSASKGSTLTIAINDNLDSTYFWLDSTSSAVDLSNLTLNINAAEGFYTEDMEYTLFNAKDTTFLKTLSAINLNNVPGFTAVLKTIKTGDAEVKFKLNKIRVTPPATGGARNTESAHRSTQAVTMNISRFTIGEAMGAARANATESPGGYGRSSETESPTGNFTRNPLRAPDISKDFLSLTQGSMMTESKENAKRWSPARTEKTGVWVQPFGMIVRQTADKGAPGYKTRTGGLLAGFDHRVRYDVILGAGLGYAQTKLNFDSNQGKMGIKDKFLTFFGTWFRGPWYLEGSILMGLEKYQGSRNTGINNQFALNHHNGYQLTPKIGGGYTFDVKGYKLRTYTTFDYAHSTQYGYQETGVGAAYWNKSDASMLRSELGLNLTKVYECSDYSWKPGLTLSVVNKKPIKKGKIISPSAGSFESTAVTTTDIAPGVESTWKFSDGYSLSASWTGEFGPKYNLQEASVKFAKKF